MYMEYSNLEKKCTFMNSWYWCAGEDGYVNLENDITCMSQIQNIGSCTSGPAMMVFSICLFETSATFSSQSLIVFRFLFLFSFVKMENHFDVK